ncbi:MAG: glycosyltransferase [Planctomycetes bacterium]|nr:glycosyltransferase [Planctomycetota bacterium]
MEPWLVWVLLGAWGFICAIWVRILVGQLLGERLDLFLRTVPGNAGAGQGPSPLVRAIVPVRNAGREVLGCLDSLVSQDSPGLRITVVDDRSDDGTPAYLKQLAQNTDRLEILRIDDLPAGWLAKAHALWTGARCASEEWLLFLDDDCLLESGAVRAAIGYATRHGVDLLSLWPRHRAGGFWEHTIIPLCGAILALWFGSRRIRQADRAPAFANGQFILIRREAYMRMGGHAAVRDALIEDVPLAEHAQSHGLTCRTVGGADLVSVRMYRSYAGIRDGWARIYMGALRSGRKILLSVAWLAAGSLPPFVVGPVLLAVAAQDGESLVSDWGLLQGILALCVSHLLLIGAVSYRFWGYCRCARVYLLLYPISALLVLGILARAWWHLEVRRTVTWRNTTYAIDRRARILTRG